MAALSFGESEAITGTPMLGLPLCLIRGMTAQREREGEKEKEVVVKNLNLKMVVMEMMALNRKGLPKTLRLR